ncbi:MAG: hypothetical protein IJ588_00380 [Prevotella sp.]|nr:hypothetical protein [Prevotella sp.]
MKRLFFLIGLMAALISCSDDNEDPARPGRAVLVYMAANNNLGDGGYATSDLREMMEGSKTLAPENRLYVFYSHRNSACIYQVEKGDTIRRETFEEGVLSSNSNTLRRALAWMMSEAEDADDYGLVLWGHSTGWEVKGSGASSRRRAYDQERSNGTYYYMDIPDMAEALSGLPRLRFIFADCCVFQCVETAYELRDAADYIIGSPAEIPNAGAPYNTVVPAFFSRSETFYKGIADNYYANYVGRLPLSVIQTDELEQLAAATSAAMGTFVTAGEYQQTSGLMYYFDKNMVDMNDYIRTNATDEVYRTWRAQFDKVVVYKQFAATWMTDALGRHVNFSDFTATEEKYGGMSMFVYQQPSTTFLKSLNDNISQMGWYEAARLSTFGW